MLEAFFADVFLWPGVMRMAVAVHAIPGRVHSPAGDAGSIQKIQRFKPNRPPAQDLPAPPAIN
jgi:hypothetical protein